MAKNDCRVTIKIHLHFIADLSLCMGTLSNMLKYIPTYKKNAISENQVVVGCMWGATTFESETFIVGYDNTTNHNVNSVKVVYYRLYKYVHCSVDFQYFVIL